jgi:hypothetical protein
MAYLFVVSLATVRPVEASHATLAGESFVSTFVQATRRICQMIEGESPVLATFTVEGVATGPYPGTFTEQVDWDIDREPALVATFTIDSMDADGRPVHITGTKQGFAGGSCFIGNPSPSMTGVGTRVMYTANIGGFTDTGISEVNFALDATGGGTFNETFVSLLAPVVVVLEPATAVNVVGSSHTVTAHASKSGTPVPGITVEFEVVGSVETTGSCTTGATGACTFTYQGPQFPGSDAITGCPEPTGGLSGTCGAATKTWILPASTSGHVSGGGGILYGTAINGVTFGFTAQYPESGSSGLKGRGNVIDRQGGIHIKLLDVTALLIAATHATFFGNAEFDGMPVHYRVDVDDRGEGKDSRIVLPGSEHDRGVSLDTFTIQIMENGYTADGPLTQGNIQVHP